MAISCPKEIFHVVFSNETYKTPFRRNDHDDIDPASDVEAIPL
jgi:hypothetical protein